MTPPAPALSVVVRVVGGGASLQRCLERVVPQVEGRAIEIIVPYDSTVGPMDAICQAFPQVNFLNLGVLRTMARPGALGAAHELYDVRTTHGLLASSGRIVALIEDYGAPEPDWCEQVLAAHELPHGVIGGAVDQAARSALNWAVYFLDFGRYQRPLTEGPTNYLTDVNVSYKRAALDLVKPLWATRYNEVTTHWGLAERGVVLWLRPQMVVVEDRGRLQLRALLLERVVWGRLFGATRAARLTRTERALYVLSSPVLPIVLLSRLLRRVYRGKQHQLQFARALPALVALTVAWCLGECLGYATRREFD